MLVQAGAASAAPEGASPAEPLQDYCLGFGAASEHRPHTSSPAAGDVAPTLLDDSRLDLKQLDSMMRYGESLAARAGDARPHAREGGYAPPAPAGPMAARARLTRKQRRGLQEEAVQRLAVLQGGRLRARGPRFAEEAAHAERELSLRAIADWIAPTSATPV